MACRGQDLLRAPSLNDTGVVDLIGIIDYERAESIDAAAVVLIRTLAHFRYGHTFLQRLEDLSERKVLQLSAEKPEFFRFVCIFLRCENCVSLEVLHTCEGNKLMGYSLFGIAKNATTVTVFR